MTFPNIPSPSAFLVSGFHLRRHLVKMSMACWYSREHAPGLCSLILRLYSLSFSHASAFVMSGNSCCVYGRKSRMSDVCVIRKFVLWTEFLCIHLFVRFGI